jgi:hypothetical protein
MRLPSGLTGALVRGADVLDRFGLLPRAMIEPDPMFSDRVRREPRARSDTTRASITSGSAAPCSAFCVMGRIKPGPTGRRSVTRVLDLDERVEDGPLRRRTSRTA